MKFGRAMIVAAISVAVMGVAVAQQTPIGQLNMSAVPQLEHDAIRRVQILLNERGFNAGRIDGVPGPVTQASVRSFQEKYGMRASGEIDNQLLFALGAVDLAGPAR